MVRVPVSKIKKGVIEEDSGLHTHTHVSKHKTILSIFMWTQEDLYSMCLWDVKAAVIKDSWTCKTNPERQRYQMPFHTELNLTNWEKTTGKQLKKKCIRKTK